MILPFFLQIVLIFSSLHCSPMEGGKEFSFPEFRAKKRVDPHVDKNPLWSSFERKISRPYLVEPGHPLRKILDDLFYNRPTLDRSTLTGSGFEILCHRPRSFIYVVSHPKLPNLLCKLYLDTELRIKSKIPGWRWFVYRCQGQEKIAALIQKKKLKHFCIPWKGLYPLSTYLAPDKNATYDPKHTVLIVEKMDLVSKENNLLFWKTKITKEHLRELYLILKRCASIRSRPDNIHFTQDGRLAIIDTEYPHNDPDYASITRFLNDEMGLFWQKLVK